MSTISGIGGGLTSLSTSSATLDPTQILAQQMASALDQNSSTDSTDMTQSEYDQAVASLNLSVQQQAAAQALFAQLDTNNTGQVSKDQLSAALTNLLSGGAQGAHHAHGAGATDDSQDDPNTLSAWQLIQQTLAKPTA